ncbi:MAG: hypothetical protein JWQ22_1414 [Devosia sp.]|nr:hypothetical protein [Devosia sp.]
MPPRMPQGGSPTNIVQALEADLKLKQAQALWDAGQPGEALHACNHVLRSDPSHAQALFMMGMIALEIGGLDVAIGSLERAAASAPGVVRIRIGLGHALLKANQPDKAAAVFAKALQLNANSGAAHRGMGLAQLDLDHRDKALKSFRKALKLKPDDTFSAFVIEALTSSAPAAPRGFVPTLFDDYAEQFDQHLTGKLGYRVPEEIAEMVIPHLGGSNVHAVDLGCGTGLVGAALGSSLAAIDGIDLSPKMLAKAEARQLYRTLQVGDAADLLNTDPLFAGPYELVTAADVFVYVGWLEPIFAAVRARMAPGGLFAFSVESTGTAEVEIRSSGRFVHSAGYVSRLCQEFGFTLVTEKTLIIRQEFGTAVPGVLYLLQAR